MPPLSYNIVSTEPTERRLPNPNAEIIKQFDVSSMTTLYNVAQHKRDTDLKELKLTGDEIGDTNSILKDLKTLPKHNLLLQQKMVDYGLTLKDSEKVKSPEAAIEMHKRAQQLLMDNDVRNWIKENEYYKEVHQPATTNPEKWMEMMGGDKYKEYSDRVTAGLQPGGENLMNLVPGSMVDVEGYKLRLKAKKELEDLVLNEHKQKLLLSKIETQKALYNEETLNKIQTNNDTMLNEITDPVDKAAADNYLRVGRAKNGSVEAESERQSIMQEYVNDKRNGTHKYNTIFDVELALEQGKKIYTTNRNTNVNSKYTVNGSHSQSKLKDSDNIISTTVESIPGSNKLIPNKSGGYSFMLTDNDNINRNITIDKNGKLSVDGGSTSDKGADLAFADGSYNKTFHTVRAIDSKGHIYDEYNRDFVDLAPLGIKYGYDGVTVDNGKVKGILTFKSEKDANAAAKAMGDNYKVYNEGKAWRISNKGDKNGDVVEMDLSEVGKLKEKYMTQQTEAINNVKASPSFDVFNPPISSGPNPIATPPVKPATREIQTNYGPDTNSKQEAEQIIGVLSDTIFEGTTDGKPATDNKALLRKLHPDVLKEFANLNYASVRTKDSVIKNSLPLIFTDVNEGGHASTGNHPTGNAIDIRFSPAFPNDTKTNMAWLDDIQHRNAGWAEKNSVDLYYEASSMEAAQMSLAQIANTMGGKITTSEDQKLVTITYKDKEVTFKIRPVKGTSPHIHMDIFPNSSVGIRPDQTPKKKPDYTEPVKPTEIDQDIINADSIIVVNDNGETKLVTKPVE